LGLKKLAFFLFLTEKKAKEVVMKRAKVLLVSQKKEDVEILEKAFEKFLKEGGEILVTEEEEKGLEVLLNEKPELLFLDEACMHKHKEQWIQPHTHVVLIQESKEPLSEEYLLRPLSIEALVFKAEQVFPKLDTPPVIPI
jgi:hypothetical protein